MVGGAREVVRHRNRAETQRHRPQERAGSAEERVGIHEQRRQDDGPTGLPHQIGGPTSAAGPGETVPDVRSDRRARDQDVSSPERIARGVDIRVRVLRAQTPRGQHGRRTGNVVRTAVPERPGHATPSGHRVLGHRNVLGDREIPPAREPAGLPRANFHRVPAVRRPGTLPPHRRVLSRYGPRRRRGNRVVRARARSDQRMDSAGPARENRRFGRLQHPSIRLAVRQRPVADLRGRRDRGRPGAARRTRETEERRRRGRGAGTEFVGVRPEQILLPVHARDHAAGHPAVVPQEPQSGQLLAAKRVQTVPGEPEIGSARLRDLPEVRGHGRGSSGYRAVRHPRHGTAAAAPPKNGHFRGPHGDGQRRQGPRGLHQQSRPADPRVLRADRQGAADGVRHPGRQGHRDRGQVRGRHGPQRQERRVLPADRSPRFRQLVPQHHARREHVV